MRTLSERYSTRPLEELLVTVTEAVDANFAILVLDDYSKMDQVIENISKFRLEGGFSLSEVQMAFELYRTVTMPILVRELPALLLPDAVGKVNNCLTYTIRKFSDYFQSLHDPMDPQKGLPTYVTLEATA